MIIGDLKRVEINLVLEKVLAVYYLNPGVILKLMDFHFQALLF